METSENLNKSERLTIFLLLVDDILPIYKESSTWLPRVSKKSPKFHEENRNLGDFGKAKEQSKYSSLKHFNSSTNCTNKNIFLLFWIRKSNMISVPSLHSSWDKKRKKKAEEKNVKRLENELKEAAKRQREV